MAKEEIKYEQAVRELEEIVEKMENDELDIDQLSEQLKRQAAGKALQGQTNQGRRRNQETAERRIIKRIFKSERKLEEGINAMRKNIHKSM